MTCEQEQKYLKNGGLLCPYCYSSHIIPFRYPESYGQEVRQQVDCQTCGKTWHDVYVLRGATEYK
jgi:hypothetical protein